MKQSIPGIAAFGALTMVNAAFAGSIGVNFSGGDGNEGTPSTSVIPSTTSAGFVPQMNWNDANRASGVSAIVLDDSGTATGASLAWTSNNTWGRSSTASDGNSILLGKYLDGSTNAGNPPQNLPATVTVSNVPYATYDVYVYVRRNETAGSGDPGPSNPGYSSDYTVNGTTQDVRTGDVGVDNSSGAETFNAFILADPTSPSSTIGNYIVFQGVTGSTLNLSASNNTDNWRSALDGFQIVQTPEPASIGLLGLGAIGLLARRRTTR